jgi:poly-gamma-glutamate capsule biosynthesis protein CapA/YwtB (metallophosphatase superfamily)
MTLADAWTLLEDPALSQKTSAAALVAAKDIMLENVNTANHANRLVWAASTFTDHVGAGNQMRKALVSYYTATKTLAEMAALTDAEIQTVVNAAVNVFATGA